MYVCLDFSVQTIVDTVPDGVYVLDEDYEFEFVNDALAAMHKYDTEEIVEADVGLVSSDEGLDSSEQLRHMLREGDIDIGYLEEHLETADGDRLDVEIRFREVRDDEATFQGTVGVVRDVTLRKSYERQIERQRDNLEVLNKIVRHDIRNTLQAVLAYAEILEYELDDSSCSRATNIRKNAESGIELTARSRCGQVHAPGRNGTRGGAGKRNTPD